MACRRTSIELALVLSCVACAPDGVTLELPTRPDVTRWLLVYVEDGAATLEVLSAGASFRAETEAPAGVEVEAIGYGDELALPPGPLAPSSAGVGLPEPRVVLSANAGAGVWTPRGTELSERARAVRVPASDDCTPWEATHVSLPTDPGELGVTVALPLEPDGLVLATNTRWTKVTRAGFEPFPRLVANPGAGVIDSAGDAYVTDPRGVWALRRVAGTWTASRAWSFPERREPFTIASPRPGVLYFIDYSGALVRTSSRGTTVLHQFAYTVEGANHRGQVYADGERVYAGVGSDPSYVVVEPGGGLTRRGLTEGEGAQCFLRFAELGVVIGTNAGVLRAESLGFEVIPDPLGNLPRGGYLRALLPVGDRLYFGGTNGLFGELTPRRVVCAGPRSVSTVRFIEPLGDELIATGAVLESAQPGVTFTRYRAE